MTLTINIHGRDYRVPPAIEPEPEQCARFDAAIRAQLHASAAAAGVPKQTIQRPVLTPLGAYEFDDAGEVKTVAEAHWLELPDALHDAVVVPTVAELLAPAPLVEPAVLSVPSSPDVVPVVGANLEEG